MAKSIPGNLEAEKSILGAILLSPESASIALATLADWHFSGLDNRNVLVYRAMQMLADKQVAIDVQTVNDQLVTMQLADEVGSPMYLTELIDACINPDNIDYYLKIVQDQAVLREFLKEIDKIGKEYSSGKIEDINDFLAHSSDDLNQIISQRRVSDFRPIDVVANTVSNQLNMYRSITNKRLTGVDTGYPRLNDYTHGWQKGSLNVIAARPSVGKTAFAINLIYNAAYYMQAPVAFFSCEMPSEQIVQRLTACQSLVNLSKIQLGDFDKDESVKVKSALENISKLPIYFDDTPNQQLGDIVVKARKLYAAHPDLCAIFIDYLNIISTSSTKKIENRSLEIALITMTLKQLARSLNIPIILLAQLNRDADRNDNQSAPNLSTLKESRSIEQDADTVVMLYRSDYYDKPVGSQPGRPGNSFVDKVEANVSKQKASGKDVADTSVVQVALRKNRNGKTGKIPLIFSKNYQRFDVPSAEMEDELDSL